jgi:heme oxygenase (biliverdin-IX-beta and delta-forming)
MTEHTERVQLAARLRAETTQLHRDTERTLGVPAGIGTRADYTALLQTMLAFHLAAEAAFHAAEWRDGWTHVGVAIDDHDRSHQVRDDLRQLGSVTETTDVPAFAFSSFGAALGGLYVVEGSSLGGRFIAPALENALGPVPLTYYAGDGRAHPTPWRSLQAALRNYEHQHDDLDDVITGATQTFSLLGEIVRSGGAVHELV